MIEIFSWELKDWFTHRLSITTDFHRLIWGKRKRDLVLNQIVFEIPGEHPLAESRPLLELLGHTPPQATI
ncbi:hypothetical protein PanWU01x14_224850 [Parasponia andersonii]|uniref:Uncharacterized protein n=1 Tax=Parasponia andersonii TaxID=3476 RepID=A0A2P5BMZ1_PARAD|nr:hypothetical protein PanWU01x14_224850 [Parasponia andersonii]